VRFQVGDLVLSQVGEVGIIEHLIGFQSNGSARYKIKLVAFQNVFIWANEQDIKPVPSLIQLAMAATSTAWSSRNAE